MWTVYQVRWEFITQLCASVPGNSKLIEGWLAARAPSVRPPSSKSLDEIASEVLSTLASPEDEPTEVSTLVFQRIPYPGVDKPVLANRMATIKAHLKDCAMQIQTYTAGYVQGEKSLRVKVANNVYWPPPPAPPLAIVNGTPFVPILGRDGAPLTEPTGVRQKAIHIWTPQGPRHALKAFEYVEDAGMVFPLSVLTAPDRTMRKGRGKEAEVVTVAGRPVVDADDLKALMLYGGMHGYGGERSEDGGRYAFTLTREDSR